MDRVLIIGAGGLVGNRAYNMMRDRFEVYGTYNTHPFESDNIYRMNCINRSETFELFSKVKPDLVIDTHALNNVDYCESHREESWLINVEGTKNLAEACKIYGSKLVFFSTDYVFDGEKMHYTEKDKPRPLNYLGMNKFISEQMLYAFQLNHLTVRTSVIYGHGGMNKQNFVKWLITKLRNGEEVSIVTDQKNNPTYADNIIDQIIQLYKKNQTGIFHITGRECVSRYDFAIKAAEVFNLDKKLIHSITTVDLHQIAPRPSVVNMSVAKVEKTTSLQTDGIVSGLTKYRNVLEKLDA